tara:strand:+ start:152 stop:1417 length:1266 start_codon:yes stop_codon:yes gene_type:complete
MIILGFNPSHHSSLCILQNGEIKYFIEDERISRIKYGITPIAPFLDLLKEYQVNIITWGTPSSVYPLNPTSIPEDEYSKVDYSIWFNLLKPFVVKGRKIYACDYSNNHHLLHSAHSFYNSGFKKAVSVVVDGLGSIYENSSHTKIRETESIFECSYPDKFKIIHQNLINEGKDLNLSRAYEMITCYLGWTNNEAGKTMGLSSYGKFNSDFPQFFNLNLFNSDLWSFRNKLAYNEYGKLIYDEKSYKEWFEGEFDDVNWIWDYGNLKRTEGQTERFNNYMLGILDTEKHPELKLKTHPKKWHYDESKITDLEKDLAWRIQNDTQQIIGDHIEKAIKKTGLKQVCCAGGYFLNCVANYYFIKRFPNVEFYFEPISNDAGTAIGAAKLIHHTETKDTTIRPFKSLYLGKQYSKEELLEGIKKYI